MLFAKNSERRDIFCRGIYSLNNTITYAEWKIIKRVSNFKIIFQLDDSQKSIKVAKFNIRKGNAGTIIGTGGWLRKTGENSSLNMFFSQTNKSFKMTSRYSNLRIRGLCDKSINLN